MRVRLEKLIAKFNAKVQEDSRLRAELQGLEKTVVLDVKGGSSYHFTVKDGRIDGLQDGTAERADVTILSDSETMAALLSGEMGPFKAYATGKLKFKGDIEDLLRFRKFF